MKNKIGFAKILEFRHKFIITYTKKRKKRQLNERNNTAAIAVNK